MSKIVYTVEEIQRLYGDKENSVVHSITTELYGKTNKCRFINFKCGICGENAKKCLYDVILKNRRLICKKCNIKSRVDRSRRFTYDYVKKHLEDNGVEILSEPNEIVNSTSNVRHKCKNCGCETSSSMTNIFYVNKGHKYTFLCNSCSKTKIPTIEMIDEVYFKPVGAELLTKEYKNCFTPLEFKCSCCGKIHHICYHNLSTGYNRKLLCPECSGAVQKRILKDELDSDSWGEVKQRRTVYDAYFQRNIKFFFNLSAYADPLDYTYHHVKPYFSNHAYAMSITNILPIKKIYHKYGTDNYTSIHIPFKKPTIDVFTEEIYRPPYLSETDEFFNPANYVVADVIIPEFVFDKSSYDADYIDRVDATKSGNLLKKKQEYANQGIVYLPFFYFEFVGKRPIVRSMLLIRGEKIHSGFAKMFGFKIDHIYARKCVVKQISSKEAVDFQNKTHIQGGVNAKYNYGLFYNNELVGCMSFGVPRASAGQKKGTWELYRLSFKLLTVIPGGASKLFKSFVKDVNPQRIESFCDIRFLNIVGLDSYSDLESVYTNLGFKLESVSNANYWYYDANNLTFRNRRSYQKHLLKDKLEFFDPELSEKENCMINGLVPQYDCGNLKYLWKNPDFVGVKPGQVLSMF